MGRTEEEDGERGQDVTESESTWTSTSGGEGPGGRQANRLR